MDADEALARQLQAGRQAQLGAAAGCLAEEDAAAASLQRAAAQHHLRGGVAGQSRLVGVVEDAVRKAAAYEDEMAQAVALSCMPLDELWAAADEAVAVSVAMGEQPPLAPEDALAAELLSWFKRDFFTWVSSPPCHACGGATRALDTALPSAEEAVHGAARTERYRCDSCTALTCFPRFNDPVKLCETRRGRCGEWANAFLLCLRAAGLEARLAVDLEDHVWAELWSEATQRWVHLDPCEAAYDKPLLYESGWGKRLSYVLAVGRHGAADVTRRYTRAYADVLKRRGLAPENWLTDHLRATTARLRAPLAPEQRAALEARDAQDQQQMLSGGSGPLTEQELALPARTTGDAAWLAARGEDGSGAVQQGPAVPPPGTRYKPAKDEGLQVANPRRLCGGAVRASGENGPSETAAAACDGSPHSKWLDFGGPRGNAWLEYRLPAQLPPARLATYALTSANDSPERDPAHCVLEAWSEEADSWVMLDEQRQLHFPHRLHRLLLPIGSAAADAPASRRFRLRVVSVADPSAANSVQLACLDLFRGQEVPLAQAEQQAQEAQQVQELRQQPGQQWQQQQQQQQEAEEAGQQPAADPAQPAAEHPWAQLFAPLSLQSDP